MHPLPWRLILLAPLLASGCQWEFNLRPEGEPWDPKEEKPWTRSLGNLEIKSSGIREMDHWHKASLSAMVTNKGSERIVLRGIQLLARDRTYAGAFAPPEDAVELLPGETKKVDLEWALDGPIGKVCHQGCTVILRIEEAGRRQSEAKIVFQRVN